MNRTVQFLLLLSVAFVFAGCAAFSKGSGPGDERTLRMSIEMDRIEPCEPMKLRYDRRLAGAGEYVTYDGPRLRLEYPVELGETAQQFAQAIETAMGEVWTRHGLALEQRPLMQLYPIRCWPTSIDVRAQWMQPTKSRYLPIPLPILPAQAAAGEEMAGLTLVNRTNFTIMYELASHALDGKYRAALRRQPGTDWFRDGAASLTASEICVALGVAPLCYRKEGEEALARVGRSIFDERMTKGKEARFSDSDYRAAAFELAARIADASPGASLRSAIETLSGLDDVNRLTFDETVRRVTGRSPEDFIPAPAVPGNAS
jgi:hypothetical protein